MKRLMKPQLSRLTRKHSFIGQARYQREIARLAREVGKEFKISKIFFDTFIYTYTLNNHNRLIYNKITQILYTPLYTLYIHYIYTKRTLAP